jgi:hypothetical protein
MTKILVLENISLRLIVGFKLRFQQFFLTNLRLHSAWTIVNEMETRTHTHLFPGNPFHPDNFYLAHSI